MTDYTRRRLLQVGFAAAVGGVLLCSQEEALVTIRGTVEEEIYSPQWRYTGEYHLRIVTESGSQLLLDIRDYYPQACSETGAINKEQIDNRVQVGDVLDFRVPQEEFLRGEEKITITANHLLVVYKQQEEKNTMEEHP